MERADFAEQVAALAAGGVEKVTELVDLTLSTGVALGASDIHLEPTAGDVAVRLRLDGVLQAYGALPGVLAGNIVARCKVLAGLLSYRTDIPQEGGASGSAYGDGVELRISTFPTLHGERVAIRVFDPGARRQDLASLGLDEALRCALEHALQQTEGLVLLAGPSGSGKTTTLYASLSHILSASAGGRSVVTVEDPIENEIAGATQTAVRPASGLTFAKSLRSLLRQDPEVIMVGEVRDVETAHIVVEAALTGHLVLSTVHAGRVALVPHRLLDMGLEPYALAGALRLVIAQRLARLLCDACKQPDTAAASLPAEARAGACVAKGCEACHGTGFAGRGLIAEKLRRSEALHDAIMAKAGRGIFSRIAAAEGADLEAQGWALVGQGRTTAQELQRVLSGDRT